MLGLSSPLGIEDLPPDEAAPLLAAWHDGVARAAAEFDAWASVSRQDPDLDDLADRLADGFAGLQIPATWLATPARWTGSADVLRGGGSRGPTGVRPPGTRRPATLIRHDDSRPSWWAAVVDYPSQLPAAWWSWHAVGRTLFPDLRICFAAGAGLAPVHHERYPGPRRPTAGRRSGTRSSTPRPTPGRASTA